MMPLHLYAETLENNAWLWIVEWDQVHFDRDWSIQTSSQVLELISLFPCKGFSIKEALLEKNSSRSLMSACDSSL